MINFINNNIIFLKYNKINLTQSFSIRFLLFQIVSAKFMLRCKCISLFLKSKSYKYLISICNFIKNKSLHDHKGRRKSIQLLIMIFSFVLPIQALLSQFFGLCITNHVKSQFTMKFRVSFFLEIKRIMELHRYLSYFPILKIRPIIILSYKFSCLIFIISVVYYHDSNHTLKIKLNQLLPKICSFC